MFMYLIIDLQLIILMKMFVMDSVTDFNLDQSATIKYIVQITERFLVSRYLLDCHSHISL